MLLHRGGGFAHKGGGTNILEPIFYVGNGGGDDVTDGKKDMSQANTLVSKLSAGTRIFRGP